jgi:NAD(P)-dependent dehydrogenase (short-subunit alcohol dehydrogenase family)
MAGRLDGRIALVTGASRGIGQAVARRYAAEGAELVLTARTVGGLEETDDLVRAAGGKAVLVPFDIADGDKIDELGLRLHERFGRLDVLVGNAAVLGGLGPLAHLEPKAWAAGVAVNLTANWRLIRSLDPLLRASSSGRAIFVTSGVTRGVFPYWGLYAATKTALETLVLTYAAETAKTPIRVNLVDPGVVRTRLRAEAMPGEDPMTLPPPESVADLFVRLAEASCREHGQRLRA